MISHTTPQFRAAFSSLPAEIQKSARKAFQLWKDNPRHPSLRFKQVRSGKPVYSVRIGIGWRALGIMKGGQILWFWIGSHAGYDKLL